MKVIVSGGRDYFDEVTMGYELGKLLGEGVFGKDDPELVCGMAKGADLTAKKIFDSSEFIVHERPANWKDMSEPCKRKRNKYGYYNALAGIKRNHSMGDEADLLVAFWDKKSTGTKDMIDYMRSLGKPVYIINY